jgi:hypothetical protein
MILSNGRFLDQHSHTEGFTDSDLLPEIGSRSYVRQCLNDLPPISGNFGELKMGCLKGLS